MSAVPAPPRLPTMYERCKQKLADLSEISRRQLKECNEQARQDDAHKEYIVSWLETENKRLVEQINALRSENIHLRNALGLDTDEECSEALQF